MKEKDSLKCELVEELYVSECQSISGRSTLAYRVGKSEGQGIWHLRISANTGKGMWCKEWTSAPAIDVIVSSGVDLTAKSFQKLHPGKSINTGGFVLAALRDLGLIRPQAANTRVHEHVPEITLELAVMARLKALSANAEAADQSRKARRKATEVV